MPDAVTGFFQVLCCKSVSFSNHGANWAVSVTLLIHVIIIVNMYSITLIYLHILQEIDKNET